MSKKPKNIKDLTVIGWREWIKLPELQVNRIKVKVDTGARSSAIHVFDLEEFTRRGELWVRFKIHPLQRIAKPEIEAECRVLEYRSVRSSSGKSSRRPVIVCQVELLDEVWPIELTLANRDAMGFRMLLGRQAIRQRFLVDPGGSYYGGKPRRPKKKKKKKKTGGQSS